jgi:hypothetical protein
VTQFTAVFLAGSLVSCHNFLGYILFFNERVRPGISYFRSKIVFLVDGLHAEALETAKPHAALSASLEE